MEILAKPESFQGWIGQMNPQSCPFLGLKE
jgi:hypothetical protein